MNLYLKQSLAVHKENTTEQSYCVAILRDEWTTI